MEANSHQESWVAWLLCSLAWLAIFAAFWFYFVFHLLLGLAGHRSSIRCSGYFGIVLLCFAAASYHGNSSSICGRVAPMAIRVWSFFLAACLCLVYYVGEFGYLRADRYSFLVRKFHPLLHAGLSRRTVTA